jgi:uncharacterized protein YecT (DUF1311 family)
MTIVNHFSRSHRLLLVLALATIALPGFAAKLAVTLPDGRVVAVDDALLKPLPRIAVSATAHGKTAHYEGYDLPAVLVAAGMPPVQSLRGKALRQVVRAHAADGYEVAFALAELDPSLGNRQVVLVDRQGGAPLPADDGPWRLVVPADGMPARWIRQVEAIAVSPPNADPASHPQAANGDACDGTTMEMVRCLDKRGEEADAELTKYLAAAQARINGSLDAKPDLAHAQAAWSDYRHAHCGDVYDFWREGSIRGPAAAACYLEITRRRTHEVWSDYLTFPDSTPPLLPEPAGSPRVTP